MCRPVSRGAKTQCGGGARVEGAEKEEERGDEEQQRRDDQRQSDMLRHVPGKRAIRQRIERRRKRDS